MKFNQKEIMLKDGRKCILRSPEKNDAAAMLEYLKHTSAETHFMVRYPEEITACIESEELCLQDILDHPHNIMIAAFVDGELAGNTGINIVRDHIKMRHRSCLGISIKEAYWHNGVGTALLSEGIAFAKRQGYEQLELGVFEDNTRAHALYRHLGFEDWGISRRAFKLKDGTYRDEIQMGQIFGEN